MTDFDKIIKDAEEGLQPIQRKAASVNSVLDEGVAFLDVGYVALVNRAIQMRRSKLARNRAEAIEMAFDFLLQKSVRKTWKRIGEVTLRKKDSVGTALCRKSISTNIERS